MKILPVNFESQGLNLEGMLFEPAGAVDKAVVVCHPHPLFGGDMGNIVVARIAQAFARKGFAALRFNFRGVGKSEGEFDEGIGEADDALCALEYLRTRYNLQNVAMAGYSFGAMMALKAAARSPHCSGVYLAAPPVSFLDCSGLGGFAKPKNFVVGGRDEYCRLADFKIWYNALPEPKSVWVVEGADHFFGGFVDKVGDLLAESA